MGHMCSVPSWGLAGWGLGLEGWCELAALRSGLPRACVLSYCALAGWSWKICNARVGVEYVYSVVKPYYLNSTHM